MFWLDVHAAVMKRQVLTKMKSKEGLAGDKPTSSERHADNICTETSRLGADYRDVKR